MLKQKVRRKTSALTLDSSHTKEIQTLQKELVELKIGYRLKKHMTQSYTLDYRNEIECLKKNSRE